LLFNKIHTNLKSYDLKINKEGIIGRDEKISFRLYRNGEGSAFEVLIDGITSPTPLGNGKTH
jgi:hypothetical protein